MSKRPYISPSFSYVPLEETLEILPKKKDLFIGIPKETSFQENRIPLIPESVSLLVNNGHEIVIETGAGTASNIQDSDYADVGAKIVYTSAEVYQADIVLKVAPPSEKELDLMQERQSLIPLLLAEEPPKFFNQIQIGFRVFHFNSSDS